MVMLALLLAGCHSGTHDVDSKQRVSGWYCLGACATIDVGSDVETHDERKEVKQPINEPEKKDET